MSTVSDPPLLPTGSLLGGGRIAECLDSVQILPLANLHWVSTHVSISFPLSGGAGLET